MHLEIGIDVDQQLIESIDELEERIEDACLFVICLIKHEQDSQRLIELSHLMDILDGDDE